MMESSKPAPRPQKGASLLILPDAYTVIDIETTGLRPDTCSILELSALRIRQDTVFSSYSMLINPGHPIAKFITKLTGITAGLVSDAPPLERALPGFLDFIGDDILIGHNVNFDVNFIYDASVLLLSRPLENPFVDTLRLSRRHMKHLPNHRLETLAQEFNISYEGAHRALADCRITHQVYQLLKEYITQQKKCKPGRLKPQFLFSPSNSRQAGSSFFFQNRRKCVSPPG